MSQSRRDWGEKNDGFPTLADDEVEAVDLRGLLLHVCCLPLLRSELEGGRRRDAADRE